jgi:hypothetical protein
VYPVTLFSVNLLIGYPHEYSFSKHTDMSTGQSTCISIITEKFSSTHIGYLVEAFSVYGYPYLSTFSKVHNR